MKSIGVIARMSDSDINQSLLWYSCFAYIEHPQSWEYVLGADFLISWPAQQGTALVRSVIERRYQHFEPLDSI